MAAIQLVGQVVNRTTRQGIGGLRVEVWDRDVKSSDLLGEAVTDAGGRFAVSFDEAAFSDGGTDVRPDIFFTTFSGGRTVYNTEGQPLTNWIPSPQPLIIVLDPEAPPQGETYVVQGEVGEPDGTPLPNRLVRAHDQALRNWRSLGQAHADSLWRYRITYEPALLKQWGKSRAAATHPLPAWQQPRLDQAGFARSSQDHIQQEGHLLFPHVLLGGESEYSPSSETI
jgi:hypothetical protein